MAWTARQCLSDKVCGQHEHVAAVTAAEAAAAAAEGGDSNPCRISNCWLFSDQSNKDMQAPCTGVLLCRTGVGSSGELAAPSV